MSDPDDDRRGRPGHRYDAPETDEEGTGKSWAYLVLGTLVLLLLILVATGTVQVFPS